MAGHGIVVSAVLDAAAYISGVTKTLGANKELGSSFKTLGADAQASARTQIAAAVKADETLRANVESLKLAAAAAPTGSREQIVATNLANAAQLRLARSYGVTAKESSHLAGSARTVERDVGKATRGFLAGSGVARGYGRSLAFASAGFLGFEGASAAFKGAIDGAEALKKANDSLAVVIRRNNGLVGQAIPRLDNWAKAQEKLGVSQADALAGLQKTVVLTGSVQKGMLAYTMGLELSRALNISLNSALRISGKAIQGQTASLTRYGIVLPKTTNAQKIFAAFQARFAHQAQANTSAFDRLRAALSNIETEVGTALLPTFEKWARAAARWLSTSRHQKEVTDDVKRVVHALVSGVRALSNILKTVNRLTGSFAHTLELVAAVKLARILSRWLSKIRLLGPTAVKAGVEADGAFAGMAASATAAYGPVAALLGVAAAGYIAYKKTKALNIGGSGGTISNLHRTPGGGDVFQTGGQWYMSTAANPNKYIPITPAQAVRLGASVGGGDVRLRVGHSGRRLGVGSSPTPPQKDDGNVFGKAANAAAATTKFVLPSRLQLAQVRAGATKALADDLKVAKQIRAYILKQIPHLHGKKLIDAYKQLGAVNRKISGDVKKAAEQAKKAGQFKVPLALQLAQAKAEALGKPITAILNKMKAAAQRALKSGKLSIQGQIDAWNQIADINQQLGSAAKTALGAFKQLNTRKIAQSIQGLTKAQRAALRAAVSQVGPRGTVPSPGSGAYGYIIDPKTDRPGDVYLDGKKVGKIVKRHNQRDRRRNPTQRRGPNAATA